MHKISIYKEQRKTKIQTKYAILTINSIDISPEKLESYCSEILFQKENLEYIFDKKIESPSDEKKMTNFFIPTTTKDEDIENYLLSNMESNHNFYSFFAEALLTVALKDIFNYTLTNAAVDLNSTLVDSHTGADACLYDEQNEVLVLGEAKFYKSFSDGLNKIITDFTCENGFRNKLDSFYRHCINNTQSEAIIIKKLNKSEMDLLYFDEFLTIDIIYAGFVLHEHTGEVSKYLANDFYDGFNISAEKISTNVDEVLGKKIETNHSVLLFHLPIKNKKELINKIIEIAKNKRDR